MALSRKLIVHSPYSLECSAVWSATVVALTLVGAHARRGLVEELMQPLDRFRAAGVFRHHALEVEAVVVGHVLQARQAVGDGEVGERRVLADFQRELLRLG